MMLGLILAASVVSAVLAAHLTERVRRFASQRGIEDVPNQRSSHDSPTPRGGGLAVVAVALCGMAGALLLVSDAYLPVLTLLGGGTLIAVVGWLDDLYSLRARTRLIAQFAAAGIAVIGASTPNAIDFGAWLELTGWIATGFALLYIVWLTNLYNFMDGIDGIAAGECATVAVPLAIACGLVGEWHYALLLSVLAASCLGFLKLNWHPARIFMGDVCSGFLGFLLAVVGLHLAQNEVFGFTAFLILMGLFIVDATFTLFRRLFSGQRIYQAHRSHAYQRATQLGWSHGRVTSVALGINVFWLLPLAVMTDHWPEYGAILLAASYAPLIGLCLVLKAGKKKVGEKVLS